MTTQDLKSGIKLRWWPTPQDYNEAVQNPATSFEDSELRTGEIFVGPLGLPVPVCGAFASVYRMRSRGRELALRCFLRSVEDQQHRYQMISNFVRNDDLPATVDFEFEDRGIQVNGQWFPVLKMEWVPGETLDQFIVSNIGNSAAILDLAEKFLKLFEALQLAGIAHGDLQHGNIMIANGELRLVDYDGMYVPEMFGLYANELGHRNYQHPKRFDAHFGAYLDNFAAWVIYTSLRAIAVEPDLYRRMGGGDDCLLFKAEDFTAPRKAAVFRALESHSDDLVRRLARMVRANLALDPSNVPPLIASPAEVELDAFDQESGSERGDWARSHSDYQASANAAMNPVMRRPLLSGRFVSSVGSELGIDPELTMPCPRNIRIEPTLRPFDYTGTSYLLALILILPSITGNWYCLAALGVCLLSVVYYSGTPVRHEVLAIAGTATVGTVISVKYGKRNCTVKYEFCDEKGKLIRAEERMPTSQANLIPRAGQPATVLFQHGNTRRCVLYAACMYKAV